MSNSNPSRDGLTRDLSRQLKHPGRMIQSPATPVMPANTRAIYFLFEHPLKAVEIGVAEAKCHTSYHFSIDLNWPPYRADDFWPYIR